MECYLKPQGYKCPPAADFYPQIGYLREWVRMAQSTKKIAKPNQNKNPNKTKKVTVSSYNSRFFVCVCR